MTSKPPPIQSSLTPGSAVALRLLKTQGQVEAKTGSAVWNHTAFCQMGLPLPNGEPYGAMVSPHSQSRTEDDLFYGRFGLRAGWGMALFLTAALLLLIVLTSALSFVRGSTKHAVPHPASATETAGAVALNDGALLLAVTGSALLLARLERRSVGVYGLGLRHIPDVLPGALAGLLVMGALVALLHALHLVVFDEVLLDPSHALRSGLGWLLTFALVAIFEESFFRGYLQYTLTRGLLGVAERLTPERARAVAFSLSAVLLSMVFAFTHAANGGETATGLIGVFVAGLVFSYALWRTGALWWGVGFHAAWDWAESFLFGVPDSGRLSAGRLLSTHPSGNPLLSGGPAGPEGSLFFLPALLLVVVVLQGVRARTQPPLAAQDQQRIA